jgi:phage gp46-like protein
MTDIIINVRINEGCAKQPMLLWDTVWDSPNGIGDWALAGSSETLNRGGLRAQRALETAVILCWFTDRYCPPTHPLAQFADGDLRGWWGDGVDVRADLGEGPLGSLFWLLERSYIDPVATPRWAVSMGLDALSPLVRQKAVVDVEVQAYVSMSPNRLDVACQLYGRKGIKLFDRRYDDIWNQEFTPLSPTAFGPPLYDAPNLDFSDPANTQLLTEI